MLLTTFSQDVSIQRCAKAAMLLLFKSLKVKKKKTV